MPWITKTLSDLESSRRKTLKPERIFGIPFQSDSISLAHEMAASNLAHKMSSIFESMGSRRNAIILSLPIFEWIGKNSSNNWNNWLLMRKFYASCLSLILRLRHRFPLCSHLRPSLRLPLRTGIPNSMLFFLCVISTNISKKIISPRISMIIWRYLKRRLNGFR